jgi:PAS domain S-box-containing protein
MSISEHDYVEAQAVLAGLARSGIPGLPAAATRTTNKAATSAPDAAARVAPDRTLAPVTWSEQMFRELIEALPDAVVLINAAGAIVLVNTETEKMFGYSRTDLLGHAIEQLVPQRFRGAHVGHRTRYFTEMRARPMGRGLVLMGRRRNGEEFPVEISLSPLHTGQGPLATSVIRDVSHREREEAKFRTLVENIPAVTFFAPLDESAPELYVSPQIEQLLGFSRKEWLEDPVLWYRQLHPEDRERWNRQFAPTCAAGTPFRSVYRFIAKDGRVVWVHGSANLVCDADGRPLFLQGVAFDVTSIKEAEVAVREAQESLRALNAELEQRVRERTEALDRSMAELRERTDELEQFSYVASHDLREPLRTLVNFPQRLAREYAGKLDAQADEWINRIINGGTRMRQLIDDLSQYARVIRRDRAFGPTDCGSVARDACANLQASLEESGAVVAIGELPTVLGNQQQLMLLYQNLIGNAVKFRDTVRPVHVEVGAQRDGDGWLCWVRDNGIGIEKKYLSRIFGLGERLHAASKYAGTGFGLAICEKIVTRHRGRIWATSELGQGSTFCFTLPETPEVDSNASG